MGAESTTPVPARASACGAGRGVLVDSAAMETPAENLPAAVSAPGGAGTDEALFAGLPEEAVRVCAEILCGAEDERDRALGARLASRAGFVLSAAPEGGPGALFASIPPFPRETRRRDPPNPAAYAQLDPATTDEALVLQHMM